MKIRGVGLYIIINNVAWTELPFSLTLANLMFRATLCNRHDYYSHFTDETAENKEAQ